RSHRSRHLPIGAIFVYTVAIAEGVLSLIFSGNGDESNMAIQVSKRRFNVREYERMGETGILDEDSNVELIEGVVIDMRPPDMLPPREHRFTVEEYNGLIEAGILQEDDRVELIEGEIIEMSPIGKNHV